MYFKTSKTIDSTAVAISGNLSKITGSSVPGGCMQYYRCFTNFSAYGLLGADCHH